jgi:peptidoglycan/xylan/chitin deacetylase (PgdA/CDA1 family)
VRPLGRDRLLPGLAGVWSRARLAAALACLLWLGAGAALAQAAKSGPAAQGVPVLLYHEVVTDPAREPGETVIRLDAFIAQMAYLAEAGYHPISVDELVAHMRFGTALPAKPVVLNFDDGWRNVLNAVPVLRAHGFKASFWIIAGPKGIGWDYMEWADIEALADTPGFEVQSHSVSHPWHRQDNLVTWMSGQPEGHSPLEVRDELLNSRRTLSAHLKRSVSYFAWPCGWFTEPMVALAREAGYKALLTTLDGLNRPGDDVMRIKRTFVDGACGLDVFKQSLADGRYRVCAKGGHVTRGHLPS